MWHGINSGVIVSCDTCVLHVGARLDGMLKGSLGRSNRRINIIAATSRAEEDKHQIRVLKSCADSESPSARVSPGHAGHERLQNVIFLSCQHRRLKWLNPLFHAGRTFLPLDCGAAGIRRRKSSNGSRSGHLNASSNELRTRKQRISLAIWPHAINPVYLSV